MKEMNVKEQSEKSKKSISFIRENSIEKQIQWYKKNQGKYTELSEKIANMISGILNAENINYGYFECRGKRVDSFAKKLQSGIVKNGLKMQDLAGIRIVCYTIPTVELVSKIIEDNFSIDQKLSKDKSEILGEDKVGYQSVHFVATLNDDRLKLPENKKFKDMIFEIQIRTILQHAWAQIEHERRYKLSGELPKGIPRCFNLIAGLLELADNEFARISRMLVEYSQEVKTKTKTGELDIPINSTSVMEYLVHKYGNNKNIIPIFKVRDYLLSCLKSLESLGIKTLDDLDDVLDDKLVERYTAGGYEPDFTDIIVGSLIIKYGKEFFVTCDAFWNSKKDEAKVTAKFGVDINKLKKYYTKR